MLAYFFHPFEMLRHAKEPTILGGKNNGVAPWTAEETTVTCQKMALTGLSTQPIESHCALMHPTLLFTLSNARLFYSSRGEC